jgi:hypothetical protein
VCTRHPFGNLDDGPPLRTWRDLAPLWYELSGQGAQPAAALVWGDWGSCTPRPASESPGPCPRAVHPIVAMGAVRHLKVGVGSPPDGLTWRIPGLAPYRRRPPRNVVRAPPVDRGCGAGAGPVLQRVWPVPGGHQMAEAAPAPLRHTPGGRLGGPGASPRRDLPVRRARTPIRVCDSAPGRDSGHGGMPRPARWTRRPQCCGGLSSTSTARSRCFCSSGGRRLTGGKGSAARAGRQGPALGAARGVAGPPGRCCWRWHPRVGFTHPGHRRRVNDVLACEKDLACRIGRGDSARGEVRPAPRTFEECGGLWFPGLERGSHPRGGAQ